MSAGSAQNTGNYTVCCVFWMSRRVERMSGVKPASDGIWLSHDRRTKNQPSFDAPECFARQFSDS